MSGFLSYRGVTFDLDGSGWRLGRRPALSVAKGGADDFADGVSWSSDDVSRPGGHGAFALEAVMGAKARAVTVHVLADSRVQLAQVKSQVLSLGDGGGFHDLVWHDGAVRRVAKAQVRAVSGWRESRSMPFASCLIQWQCPDPWWFGESTPFEVRPGGSVSVETAGSVDAWPVVTVHGPVGLGYSLSARGYSLTVNAAVSSGGRHVIDMETGSVVTQAGVELQDVVIGYPFAVPPREPVTVVFSGSGSGRAVIEVTDRYI